MTSTLTNPVPTNTSSPTFLPCGIAHYEHNFLFPTLRRCPTLPYSFPISHIIPTLAPPHLQSQHFPHPHKPTQPTHNSLTLSHTYTTSYFQFVQKFTSPNYSATFLFTFTINTPTCLTLTLLYNISTNLDLPQHHHLCLFTAASSACMCL